ncbi:LamG domain-containing protein [Asanoa sp. NPDC049518]|uniref:LamG domain-containing protein n=1 Tax=unclassified Asanoa TaxID=2685164 RepID=UPI00342321C3
MTARRRQPRGPAGPSAGRGNAWTHLVVVWNKGWGRAQLYVNGVLEGTGPTTSSWRAPETRSLHIGAAQAGNFIGGLDDLRLYQRTLTAAEIDNLDDL